MNQDELARAFAMGSEKGEASSMYIERDAIYSYGKHFPIAYRIEEGYLFNTDKYSHTTSCHQTKVRRALGGEIIETDTDEIIEAIHYGVDTLGELRERQIIESL